MYGVAHMAGWLFNDASRPVLPLDAHLHSSKTPILTVVMASFNNASPRLSLLVIQDGKNTKDDGDTGVERNAHQPVGYALGNILEMHRLAFDQDANRNNRIEGGSICGVGKRRQISS